MTSYPTYRREDLGTDGATLAFCEDLASLTAEVEDQAVRYNNPGLRARETPIANGFLEILASLHQGYEPLEAIIHGIGAWQMAHERLRRAPDMERNRRLQTAQREREKCEREASEALIALKAACPFCNAEPGAGCTSASSGQAVHYTHSQRLRAVGIVPGRHDLPLPGSPELLRRDSAGGGRK